MQFAPSWELPVMEFPTFRKFFVSLHDHVIPHPRNNYHPHAISHRMLALLSLLLMTVKIVGISMVAIAPAAIVEASEITSVTVISLANSARKEGGLNPLTANSLLARAAQNKANDMLGRQYFSHNTPTGETPWSFIKAVGYSYVTAGENLAIDFSEAESIQKAWMNSPGHRANIMNASFQEIGIGISKGMYNGHQTTIVVQMFGTPIAQKVEMPAAPTPVAQPAAPAPTPPPAPAPTPTQVAPAPTTPTPTTVAPTAPVSAPVVIQPKTKPNVPAQKSAAPTTKVIIRGNELVEVPIGYQPVEIKSTDTALQGNQLHLTVTASGPATKLLATYGNNSVMLDPSENNLWHGYIPLASLEEGSNLMVAAYDIEGNLVHSPIAQFSPGVNAALDSGTVNGASVTVFGQTFNPKVWEEKITLIIMAGLIACLILAIAIRRHVQHVGLVANTAFVAMLAAFMLMI